MTSDIYLYVECPETLNNIVAFLKTLPCVKKVEKEKTTFSPKIHLVDDMYKYAVCRELQTQFGSAFDTSKKLESDLNAPSILLQGNAVIDARYLEDEPPDRVKLYYLDVLMKPKRKRHHHLQKPWRRLFDTFLAKINAGGHIQLNEESYFEKVAKQLDDVGRREKKIEKKIAPQQALLEALLPLVRTSDRRYLYNVYMKERVVGDYEYVFAGAPKWELRIRDNTYDVNLQSIKEPFCQLMVLRKNQPRRYYF